jgi:mannose-6-phosphate isomerase-like protein (cupin superfamily)
VNAETLMHRHHVSEEIYPVTEGRVMTWKDQFEIKKGDTVCLPRDSLIGPNTAEFP